MAVSSAFQVRKLGMLDASICPDGAIAEAQGARDEDVPAGSG